MQYHVILDRIITASDCIVLIIMGMASQITSPTNFYSTVYSGADRRKHQSLAPMAFVREIHRWPMNLTHKWPVTWIMLPVDDVIMVRLSSLSKVLIICTLISHPRETLLPMHIVTWRSLIVVLFSKSAYTGACYIRTPLQIMSTVAYFYQAIYRCWSICNHDLTFTLLIQTLFNDVSWKLCIKRYFYCGAMYIKHDLSQNPTSRF